MAHGGLGLTLPLVLIGVGLLLPVVGVFAIWRSRRFDRVVATTWIPARGYIVDVLRDFSRGDVALGNGPGPPLDYAMVRFLDAYGRQWDGRSVIAKSWRHPTRGAEVSLRYDPTDPTRVMLDQEGGAGPFMTVLGIFLILGGIPFVLLGGLFLVISMQIRG